MTVSKITKLFSPIKVGVAELQHRVVLAPLTRRRANKETAIPADFAVEYYSQRATRIYSKEQIAEWKAITDAVHAKGGYIFCQLWALGRTADPRIVPTVWSAGSIPWTGAGAFSSVKPENFAILTESDLDRFVGHYRQAALNAVEAGFDGVEIHGANGYLVDQFLQSNTNDRTDSYGGSLENRFRFPLRVLNAVVDAIGPERVGIRMSPFSSFQGMREADPLSVFVPWAEAIVKAQPSLAFVHAVEPRAEGASDAPANLQKPEDTLTPIRDVLNGAGVNLIVAGGFTPESAIEHASETDDLVAFGRHFIPNPDLPARIKNGWPLTEYDRSSFYTPGEKGYSDYVVYTPDDLLERSERAWLAANEAWNEDRTPQTTTERAAAQAPSPDLPCRTPRARKAAIREQACSAGKNQVSKPESTAPLRLDSSTEVFIKPEAKALERAALSAEVSSSNSRLILWTDASIANKTSTATGCGVVLQNNFTWVRITARRFKTKTSETAELQAIDLGLEYAVQVARRTKNHADSLRVLEIFTDCQAALQWLGNGGNTRRKRLKARQQEQALITTNVLHTAKSKIDTLREFGVMIEFHWVPRNKVMGNILADKGAGLARLMAGGGYNKPGHVMIEYLPTDSKKATGVPQPKIHGQTLVPETHMADQVALVLVQFPTGGTPMADGTVTVSEKPPKKNTRMADGGAAKAPNQDALL
ncbi:hypothetical protein F66182_1038 [Fusarium sp. NRRL 66182]|nr:hypothetical protein F66182_1038 [Fusarium sp. NRRL 66182]